MPKYFKRLAVLGKRETTYGTDIVPANADAVLFFDVELTPFEATYVTRRPASPFFRAPEQVVAFATEKLKGYVEVAGAGAAGTVPGYGHLLRAAGLLETVNAGVSVVYTPAAPPYDSDSLYWNMDGERHRMLGARGTFELTMVAGEIPKLTFDLMSLYVAPTSVAMPAPDWAAYQKGKPVNVTNTPTVSLQGTTVILRSFTLNAGQKLFRHNMPPTVDEVRLTDREPSGSISFEAPAISVKDWFTPAASGTEGALQIIHGVGAGQIFQVDLPKVRITNPRYREIDGIALIEADLNVLPNGASGNDEFSLTIK